MAIEKCGGCLTAVNDKVVAGQWTWMHRVVTLQQEVRYHWIRYVGQSSRGPHGTVWDAETACGAAFRDETIEDWD